jgi:hypothetical protein
LVRAWHCIGCHGLEFQPAEGEQIGMRNARLAVFSAAIAFLAALAAGPVISAAAVTLSQNEWVLYNFDLTGNNFARPYDKLTMVWQWTDNVGDIAHTDFYGDLNGGNPLFYEDAGPSIFSLDVETYDPYYPELRDGLFSIRVTSKLGTFSVSPYAYGTNGEPPYDVRTSSIFGVFVSGGIFYPGDVDTIPEPAALPLILSGLVGIGFLAHRRKKLAA